MILHPSYFIDVVSLLHVFKHTDKVIFEKHDSYIKQTYRNRCYIAAANGKLALNIPIVHQKKGNSVPYSSIQIDHSQAWATQHLKSITSAYKSSPFFDYYVDDLASLFQEIPETLMEWNIKTYLWCMKQLYVPIDSIRYTSSYQQDPTAHHLITAKKTSSFKQEKYMQVFQEKHDFIPELCVLDLIFNLGPSARVYLTQHAINL